MTSRYVLRVPGIRLHFLSATLRKLAKTHLRAEENAHCKCLTFSVTSVISKAPKFLQKTPNLTNETKVTYNYKKRHT
ncbi:hypothetical protein ACTXT7_015752 [Hymenolepis weldensis]